jgi:hypothetical protein
MQQFNAAAKIQLKYSCLIMHSDRIKLFSDFSLRKDCHSFILQVEFCEGFNCFRIFSTKRIFCFLEFWTKLRSTSQGEHKNEPTIKILEECVVNTVVRYRYILSGDTHSEDLNGIIRLYHYQR